MKLASDDRPSKLRAQASPPLPNASERSFSRRKRRPDYGPDRAPSVAVCPRAVAGCVITGGCCWRACNARTIPQTPRIPSTPIPPPPSAKAKDPVSYVIYTVTPNGLSRRSRSNRQDIPLTSACSRNTNAVIANQPDLSSARRQQSRSAPAGATAPAGLFAATLPACPASAGVRRHGIVRSSGQGHPSLRSSPRRHRRNMSAASPQFQSRPSNAAICVSMAATTIRSAPGRMTSHISGQRVPTADPP